MTDDFIKGIVVGAFAGAFLWDMFVRWSDKKKDSSGAIDS